MAYRHWIAILMVCIAFPAQAQRRCDAPSRDSWMTAPQPPPPAVPIAGDRIFEIDPPALGATVALLADRPAVALDGSQLTLFLPRERGEAAVDEIALEGSAHSPPIANPADYQVSRFTRMTRTGLQPYLVRAVYPVATPHFAAGWDGRILTVSAYGMGCAPFTRHPVVIFLEIAPEAVRVTASADL